MLRAISIATAGSIGAIPSSEKGQPNGVATLGADGKVPNSQLPPLQHDVGKAANQAGMLALPVTAPAMCLREDFTPPHIFFLTADPATTLANWTDTGELGGTGANPTAAVGLAAVNGVSSSYMRADGAPALSQAIVPTWTASHIFAKAGGGSASAIQSRGAIAWQDAAGGVDAKWWDAIVTANTLSFRVTNDANSASQNWLSITRAANVATTIALSTGGAVRLTIGAGDLAAGAAYMPSNPKSLTTKEYVDSGVDSRTAIVGGDGKTAQAANINAPNIYTTLAQGLYRVSAYMVQTQAATTSSVLPSLNIQYTEATTSIGMSDLLMTSSNLNQVGAHQGGSVIIAAQLGSTIGYVTGNYASVGATPMQYAVHLKIEFLG